MVLEAFWRNSSVNGEIVALVSTRKLVGCPLMIMVMPPCSLRLSC